MAEGAVVYATALEASGMDPINEMDTLGAPPAETAMVDQAITLPTGSLKHPCVSSTTLVLQQSI